MSEKNKDLKTIDDALNSGALNENDVFEFDSATVEIIYGAAERMAEELEKRPEVVRCGECKLRGTDNCWLAEIDDTDDEYETFWEPQTDDNDFCAHGQRRESEEK